MDIQLHIKRWGAINKRVVRGVSSLTQDRVLFTIDRSFTLLTSISSYINPPRASSPGNYFKLYRECEWGHLSYIRFNSSFNRFAVVNCSFLFLFLYSCRYCICASLFQLWPKVAEKVCTECYYMCICKT